MRRVTGILITIAAISLHAEIVLLAADSMKGRDAQISVGERLSPNTVKGTLVKIEGEDYWIKVAAGQLMKIHVDQNTKADKVAEGDTIKASITDERHATMLQRQKK
jgi:co-chaperonin GroES (HSP10)